MHAGRAGGRILLTGAELSSSHGSAVDLSQPGPSDLIRDTTTAADRIGQAEDARHVLYAKERHQRPGKTPLGRATSGQGIHPGQHVPRGPRAASATARGRRP